MNYITPLHHYYRQAHLEHVIGEMQRRGAPTIRAHFDHIIGAWLASEGTHRLRAAKAIGIAPTIVPIPWWRGADALERARCAAVMRAHEFASVNVMGDRDIRVSWYGIRVIALSCGDSRIRGPTATALSYRRARRSLDSV